MSVLTCWTVISMAGASDLYSAGVTSNFLGESTNFVVPFNFTSSLLLSLFASLRLAPETLLKVDEFQYRHNHWKLQLPHWIPCLNSVPGSTSVPSLATLNSLGESTNFVVPFNFTASLLLSLFPGLRLAPETLLEVDEFQYRHNHWFFEYTYSFLTGFRLVLVHQFLPFHHWLVHHQILLVDLPFTIAFTLSYSVCSPVGQ